MIGTLCITAGTIRAILAFINPNNTPKIAYDNNEYAEPLINKLIDCIGDKDGSQEVYLSFNAEEQELSRQFFGVCNNISIIFTNIYRNNS